MPTDASNFVKLWPNAIIRAYSAFLSYLYIPEETQHVCLGPWRYARPRRRRVSLYQSIRCMLTTVPGHRSFATPIRYVSSEKDS